MNGRPIIVLNNNTKREEGRKAQKSNIMAAKAISEVVRTTLGPRSMLKMLMDPMGGLVITNDGNAILREIDVNHPAAKHMIELSRTQDEEVGDGTTSVIILAGEMLHVAMPFLDAQMHPTVIVQAFYDAMETALAALDKMSFLVDVNDKQELVNIVKSSLGTKFVSRWSDLMCALAIDAVQTVKIANSIDIKRFAKVEKIPGGEITDCKVVSGCMLNKDVVHTDMKRRIENPRVLLMDCNLEYKKGESQTNVEIKKEADWTRMLKIEEEYIKRVCDDIIAHKPDLVITEKGVCDLAQHYLLKAGISVLRRVRKTDNNRIARATGATIVSRAEEIQDADIGTGCGLFEVVKHGDEYFSYIHHCKAPKACTILLRGASKDVLNEVERNLLDAMNIARNVYNDPRLVAGGGAAEMALAHAIREKAKSIEGEGQWPFAAVAAALEVIPRTLAQNCGTDFVRVVTQLKASHAAGDNVNIGINGDTGALDDMKALGVYEPLVVKAQTIKTAIEAAALLLRIDMIVSGVSGDGEGGAPAQPTPEEAAEAMQ